MSCDSSALLKSWVTCFATASLFVVSACLSTRESDTPAPKKNTSADTSKNAQTADVAQTPAQQGVCPAGTRLNERPRVCVTRGGFALGPFPLELQELCRERAPADAATCVQKQDWPFELLMSLYSEYVRGCPPGTAPGTGGICIGTDSLYGPFTMEQVMSCRAGLPVVQQSQCDALSWPPDFMRFVQKENTPPGIEVDTGSVSPALSLGTASQTPVVDAPVPAGSRAPAKENDETAESESQKTQPAIATESKPQPPSVQPKKPKLIPEAPRAPTFCVFSWDEMPGTADFTTSNVYLSSLQRPQRYLLDRKQDATLLGSRDFQNLDMCGRARFLKGCFQKVIYDNNSLAAQTFRKWSLGRLRPLEAYMAIVHQKTRLGLWRDECWRGQCRGRGLARVDAAYSVSGRKIRLEDDVWIGITHNIITNLRFGLRQISRRLSAAPSDLYQLGYSMVRTPGQRERFAREITENYRKLVACQLD